MKRVAMYVNPLAYCAVVVVWVASAVAVAEDWPALRGPHANGHSAAEGVPLHWSDSEGMAWKVDIPGLGWSTPVTHGNRIWITTALDEGKSLHALAIAADSGAVIHDVAVFPANVPKQIHKKNSHASPSAVWQDDRVYVHFGTYGTACLHADTGEVLWRQKLDYEPHHGPGGSPVLYDDLLIVNCDGTDVQFVAALDRETGAVRWKTPRAHIHPERMTGGKNMPMAFSTPTLWTSQGKTQVISAGADHIAGYDPRTGQELWWFSYDGYSIVVQPTIANDIVFCSSCYNDPILYAVRLGGEGDVSATQAIWKLEKGAPHSPSPIIVGNEIYLVSDNGIATCLDVNSGKVHWQQRLGGNFSASPILVDHRLYVLSEEGMTTVIEPGTTYRELAKNQVTGRTLASLSVVDSDLLLRTDTQLMRLKEVR